MITLNALLQQWEADAVIDRENLDAAALDAPKLHSKYLNILTQAQLSRAKTQAELNLLTGVRFRYYRGELSKDELEEYGWKQWQGVKPLRVEMDQMLEADPVLDKVRLRLAYLQALYDAVQSIMTQIKARDWQVRNAISWRQFIAGN